MGEQDDDGFSSALSDREKSTFHLGIKTASSKAEVVNILYEYNLTEEDFIDRFPDLAKKVQDLPDETFPPD
jgi:hypothetical protein